MKLINNLNFKSKLIALVSLPLLGCLYFSITHLVAVIDSKEQLTQVQSLLTLTVATNSLVHELQKERGATAVYIGSKGKKFSSEMASQRRTTDQAKTQFNQSLANFSSKNSTINDIISTITQSLNQLDKVRQGSSQLSLPLAQAIGYFTGQNKKMLHLTDFFIEISPTATNKNTSAYYYFLQAKERAGIERAVASGAFAKGEFSPKAFQKFISLTSLQANFLEEFMLKASPTAITAYQSSLTELATQEVKRMRKIVEDVGRTGPFNVEAGDWFKHATARINSLKKVEDLQATEFQSKTNKMLEQAQAQVIINLIIIVFAFSLTIFLVIAILSGLLKQLREISHTMEKVKTNQDLSVNAKVYNEDELGLVAADLNDTLATFGRTINYINDSSLQLASSADQAAVTAKGNVDGLLIQRDQTSQVATAIEQMSVTVQEVSRHATQAMQATHQINAQAIDSQGIVSDSLSTISQLVAEVNNIGELIAGLHQTTSTISNVIGVIKSIADQTNLLALNAAIEAARAGEQGRGFAVVADEVRSLAQRTQTSTVEIEEIITQLQTEANTANSVIGGSQERATESITSANKIEAALSEMINSIAQINDMIEQIAAAAEEQVNVTDEIQRNVNVIDSKSHEVSQGAQDNLTVATNQVELAEQLKSLASEFKT